MLKNEVQYLWCCRGHGDHDWRYGSSRVTQSQLPKPKMIRGMEQLSCKEWNPLSSAPSNQSLVQRAGVVRACVKGFTEAQNNDTSSPSLVHSCSHSTVEGRWVGEAGPALCEAVLAVLNHPHILNVPQLGGPHKTQAIFISFLRIALWQFIVTDSQTLKSSLNYIGLKSEQIRSLSHFKMDGASSAFIIMILARP